MGNGMSEIFKGIYVGNFRDSKDDAQLTSNNITHIISIHDNAKPLRTEMKYLCFQADDSPRANIIQFFGESNQFIHECRLGGGNVLIHCLAGVSRSVTLTVAYMVTVTDYKWEDCLRAVKSSRTEAHPNFGFQKQLQEYEHSQLAERKQDLFLRYTDYSPEEDVKKMEELLETYKKEMRDPYEIFIYPLPRNAYNRRLQKEQEAAKEAELSATAAQTGNESRNGSARDNEKAYADQHD